LQIQIEDYEGRYHLQVGEEGNMIVTKAEAEAVEEATNSLGVRLDLGEIEIELGELLSLRAGSSIELATEGPLRCFLRIGATTLASGEIVLNGDKLDVRVTEVLNGE
jgi:flagellar motor switch/type III secretory pathway protein FliN